MLDLWSQVPRVPRWKILDFPAGKRAACSGGRVLRRSGLDRSTIAGLDDGYIRRPETL